MEQEIIKPEKIVFSRKYIAKKVFKIGLLLAALYLISLKDYLIFHSLTELASAAIAIAIFLLAWNSRKFANNNVYVFIGTVFLISGFLSILHTLAYRGMNVFWGTATDANLGTQLWLANQYVLAGGLVTVPFLLGKKPKISVFFSIFSAYLAVVLLAIFWWKNFPVAYVEGSGLTPFKTYSEYVVTALFLLAAYFFFQRRSRFDLKVVNLFCLVSVLLAISTILFTLYVGVYSSFNLWGHLVRLAAMYPVYIGIIEFGLMKPYDFLFGNLKNREEALKKNEKMFRDVVEDQTELICRFRPDGRLTFVNDAYCRYYGKARAALIGKPYFENVPDDVAEKDKDHLLELNQGRPVGQYEHRAVDKNGWHRWQSWTTRAIFDERKKLIGFQSVGRDITQQKYIQEALIKSEKNYRNLVDNSLVGIYKLDKDGNYTYVNEAMAKMFGFDSPEEMIQENVRSRYKDPKERNLFLKLIKEKGKLSNYEAIGATKTGNKIIVLASVTLDKDGITGIVTDITKKREVEKEALKAKNEWEKTFDSVPDLIAILDSDHKILRANKAMADRLKTMPEKCVGLNCFQCVHNADRPIANCPHSLTLADGKEHIAEVEEPALGGTFLVSTTPFFDEAGKIAGSVHVARDITERKKIEKAKDEFVSLASHQLRTPLSSIALSAELLLRGVAGKVEQGQKEYLEEIYKATKRMTLLVNNLLNVSRVEMGNFEVQPGPFDIASAAQSVIREFSPLATDKKLDISLDIAGDIPSVNLDEKSFGIIFENLLSNAIRYTPAKGKIAVSLEGNESGVLLRVSDTGIGISAGQQKKIFQKSFRAINARAASSEGAGLGLYMAKIAAEKSGANIRFESEEGKGTTFFVQLGQ